jgi:hypothetical protein
MAYLGTFQFMVNVFSMPFEDTTGPNRAKNQVYILAFRAYFLRSTFVCVTHTLCLVSLVALHAMGSFDNKYPFECFKDDCLRLG